MPDGKLFWPIALLEKRPITLSVAGFSVLIALFYSYGLISRSADQSASTSTSHISSADPVRELAYAPPLIRTSDPQIEDLFTHDSTIDVGVSLKEAEDPADYFDATARVVEKIGRAMQAGAADGASARSVHVFVSWPAVDRLGNPRKVAFLRMAFSGDDLRVARFENLSHAAELNLAVEADAVSLGRAALVRWCLRDHNAEQAAQFCRRAYHGHM